MLEKSSKMEITIRHCRILLLDCLTGSTIIVFVCIIRRTACLRDMRLSSHCNRKHCLQMRSNEANEWIKARIVCTHLKPAASNGHFLDMEPVYHIGLLVDQRNRRFVVIHRAAIGYLIHTVARYNCVAGDLLVSVFHNVPSHILSLFEKHHFIRCYRFHWPF